MKYTVGGAVVLAGVGGTLFMHYRNDHLACVTKPKGGNDSDIREMLYLVPKNLDHYVGIHPIDSHISTATTT